MAATHRGSARSGYRARLMKRTTSSGASCTRTPVRSASIPSRWRSSLKSPRAGDRQIASMPSTFARSINVSPRRHPPDRCRGRCRAASRQAGNRMAARCDAESAGAIAMSGRTCRRESMVSMPSPAAITLSGTPMRTVDPSRFTNRLARRVDRSLVRTVGASQVRCTPVIPAGEIGDGGDHGGPGSVGPSSGL